MGTVINRPLLIVILIALIAISAVSIFLAYTSLQSTEIRLDLTATQELRRVLADDMIHAVEDISTDLEVISKRLETAASSDILESSDSKVARILLDATTVGMEQYTQRINYVDGNGTLLYSTDTVLLEQIGSDESDQLYYIQVKERNQPMLTGFFQTSDDRASVSIAVPISSTRGDFEGVLAAIIPTESIVNRVNDHLSFTENEVFIIATNGTIIGHEDEELVGTNILGQFGDKNDAVNRNLELMAEGRSGVFEYAVQDGQRIVAGYFPVAFSGIHTWSVLVTTSSSQSEAFSSVLSDQRIFTIIAITLIGIIAAIFMMFILTLNRRLHNTVRKQDALIKGQLNDLQDAYERLTEQDKIKDEFINIAAHELRTPVLPIVLSAEGLAEDIGTDNNKVEIILRNAKRINKLTNDILDVSRIKSNTFRLQKDRISVKKLVEEAIQDVVLKMTEDRNPKLEIAFESKLPEGEDVITADRGRLNQVLANLLDNAVNFTDEGTIIVTLEKKDPGFIEVRVADTGKGIDASIRPKLFEKFVTKSEKTKGTGLGLYLCKAIVEAHGGKIWAEDNVGRGSVFAFILPINN